MKKIIMFFSLLSVILLVSSCLSKEEIADTVKSSMQEKFDTDSQFKAYKFQVQSVTVVRQSINVYKGIAKIDYESSSYEIPIDITVDESNVIWQAAPNSFNFVIDNRLQILQNIFR